MVRLNTFFRGLVAMLPILFSPLVLAQTDYGDAPDLTPGTGPGDYQTTIANAGPSHTIIGGGPALGSPPDADTNGQQSTNANGDDNDGTNDEDTLLLITPPDLFDSDTTYSLTLPCSGSGAFVRGWIDENRNGRFQAGESSSGTSTCASGLVTLNWSGLSLTAGAVLLRLRIASLAGQVRPNDGNGNLADDGEVEDHILTVLPRSADYGDAPDLAPGTGAGDYETTIANGGPSHTVRVGGPALGSPPDADTNGQQSANADGDDNDGNNDEDTLLVISPPDLYNSDTTYSLTLPCSGSGAFVRGWIDDNRNGRFQAGESSSGTSTCASGFVTLNWSGLSLTAGAVLLRLRIASLAGQVRPNDGNGNLADDGEVEDHFLTVLSQTFDYGDAPDLSAGTAVGDYQTLLANNGPRHLFRSGGPRLGGPPDAEVDAQQSANADGDDNNGVDDEDTAGTFPPIREDSTSYNLLLSCNGEGASVRGWIDGNHDGSFAAAESSAIGTCTATGWVNLTWSALSITRSGATFLRLRIASDATQVEALHGDSGIADDGEIEDHPLTINATPPVCDVDNSVLNPSFEQNFVNWGGSGITGNAATGWAVGSVSGALANPGDIPTGILGSGFPTEGSNMAFTSATSIREFDQSLSGLDRLPAPNRLQLWFVVQWQNSIPATASQRSRLRVQLGGTTYAQIETPNGAGTVATLSALNGATVQAPALLENTRTLVKINIPSWSQASSLLNIRYQGIGAQSDELRLDQFYIPRCGDFDFGDAPESYNTLFATGPRHRLSANLYIGSIAAERDDDGFDNGSESNPLEATDDDSDGTDDEEGVTFFALAGAIIGADMVINNTTGGPVTACAWLDVPSGGIVDGVFSESDGRCQTTNAINTTLTFLWDGLPRDQVYSTFSRFRLTSESMTTAEATGIKIDGEVEDHALSFSLIPTRAPIGNVELVSIAIPEALAQLNTAEMSDASLRALLANWDTGVALTNIDRAAIMTALGKYLDPDGDGYVARLKWDTLEEQGTIGFHVERQTDGGQWVRVNNLFLAGLISAPLGSEYVLFDRDAQAGQVYQYRLIEVEATGLTNQYGPFKVQR